MERVVFEGGPYDGIEVGLLSPEETKDKEPFCPVEDYEMVVLEDGKNVLKYKFVL